jgi:hypothetical protein
MEDCRGSPELELLTEFRKLRDHGDHELPKYVRINPMMRCMYSEKTNHT